jgi:hypothetical protein
MQSLVRRIAVEKLDESFVQLIKSLASFLIQFKFCGCCPDDLVALPVDDFEGQGSFADQARSCGLLGLGPPGDRCRRRKSERECVGLVVQITGIYLRISGRMIGDEQIRVLGLDLVESLLLQQMIPYTHNVQVQLGVRDRGPLYPSVSLRLGEIRALVEISRYLLSQTIEEGQKNNRNCQT